VRLKAEKQKRDITEAFERMKAKGHFDVSGFVFSMKTKITFTFIYIGQKIKATGT
jgi:hypothetical protein